MKTIAKKSSVIKVNSGVKAGGIAYNRNRRGLSLSVKSGIKAGSTIVMLNHNRNRR